MTHVDYRQQLIDSLVRRLHDLSEESLAQLSQFIAYLKWQEEQWRSIVGDEEHPERHIVWQYDFIEHFDQASKASTGSPEGMEIKVGPAQCGMVLKPAIWQHPPLKGEAVVEYQPTIPLNVEILQLRFAIGIRDGAILSEDNPVGFRIRLNGRRIWSRLKHTNEWEYFIVDLPNLAGMTPTIQFITDALGQHHWKWAVWGEPQLLGFVEKSE
ncbi:MAG: hypothetical protein GXO55_09835 [Chloroflexi bacterium]|nr:hypothetical protein [Chloroflexota bacterium]